MSDIPLSMTSVELDTHKVSEKYTTTSGKEKTRATTIRSMDNDGSQFANIHSGRGSVCISKTILPEVIEKLQKLNWDSDTTTKEDSDDNAILSAIQQIGKNQQKINKRLDKIEKKKK